MKRKAIARVSADSYELTKDAKDGLACRLCGDPANLEVYSPGERQRIAATGAWVMITRKLPPIEGGADKEFRVGRIFYAEHLPNADAVGFAPNGSYKVICRLPWASVCLWPYEYAAIDVTAVTEMWTAGELVFHPLRIDGARLTDICFYARSRGIGLADAAVMALGTLAGAVGWFEPCAGLAEQCEEMERAVHDRPYSRLTAAR
jgi:hypothetical protein